MNPIDYIEIIFIVAFGVLLLAPTFRPAPIAINRRFVRSGLRMERPLC